MRKTSFEIRQTGIEGLVLISSFYSQDDRGYYKKVFEREAFEQAGIPTQFLECSTILSNKGAVRGLHYQDKHSQGKLLYVLKGAIYDVALDLRPTSASFGKWYGITLQEGDQTAVFVPPGFAHGFMALEEETLFSYLCTNYYEPKSCGGFFGMTRNSIYLGQFLAVSF